MSDARIITYIKEDPSPTLIEVLSVKLNVEFVALNSVQQLFRMIASNTYHTDLILIDIEQLCKFSGNELLQVIMSLRTLINCSCPLKFNKVFTIPVGIVVTTDTNTKLIKQVMSTGYITGVYPAGDDFTIEEKALSLERLLKNEIHVPNKIHKRLNERKTQKKIKSDTNEIKLTHRQQQILNLIIEKGASNKLIARILNISESTVKLHMTQILKKHGLTNRTQLALFSKIKTLD